MKVASSRAVLSGPTEVRRFCTSHPAKGGTAPAMRQPSIHAMEVPGEATRAM